MRPYRFPITTQDRAVGAHFSGEVLRRVGRSTLDMTGVDCEFVGTAGQSFGAFLISGANFCRIGEANDYGGKGLCGRSMPISAHADASERLDVRAANTVLHRPISGDLFVVGTAGARFTGPASCALA